MFRHLAQTIRSALCRSRGSLLDSRLGVGLFVFVILLLALALRLPNLGNEPFWGDEALSYGITARSPSVSEMVSYVGAVEVHPPLYYVMLRAWLTLFGPGEVSARLLSVLFGLLCVLSSYFFSSRIFSSRSAGVVTALIMAVLPIQVEYSQEARPYIIFCFFGIMSALSAWQAVNGRRLAWSAVYVVSSAAGLWLHYSFVLALVPISAWWLLSAFFGGRGEGRFRGVRNWFFAHAMVFVAFLPWLPFMLSKMLLGKYEIYGLSRIVGGFRGNAIIEMTLQQLVWTRTSGSMGVAQLLLMLAGAVFFIWSVTWYASEQMRRESFRLSWSGFFRSPGCFLAFLAGATMLFFVMAPQSYGYTFMTARHVLPVSVFLSALFGGVSSRLPSSVSAFVVACLLVTLLPFSGAVAMSDEYTNSLFNMRGYAQLISDNYREGDVVVTSFGVLRVSVAHYLPDRIPVVSLDASSYSGLDFMGSNYRMGLVENELQSRDDSGVSFGVMEQALSGLIRNEGAGRIWFVMVPVESVDYARRILAGYGWQDEAGSNTWDNEFSVFIK